MRFQNPERPHVHTQSQASSYSTVALPQVPFCVTSARPFQLDAGTTVNLIVGDVKRRTIEVGDDSRPGIRARLSLRLRVQAAELAEQFVAVAAEDR
jgi:hypothetical protein